MSPINMTTEELELIKNLYEASDESRQELMNKFAANVYVLGFKHGMKYAFKVVGAVGAGFMIGSVGYKIYKYKKENR